MAILTTIVIAKSSLITFPPIHQATKSKYRLLNWGSKSSRLSGVIQARTYDYRTPVYLIVTNFFF